MATLDSDGSQSTQVSKIIGGLSMLASVAFLGLFIFVLYFLSNIVTGGILGLITGMVLASISIYIMWKLDTFKKLKEKMQVGKINFQWVLIPIVVLGLLFSGFLVFLYSGGLDFSSIDLDYMDPNIRQMFSYLLGGGFIGIAGWFMYLGVKNWKQIDVPNNTKRAILAVFSIIFIVAAPIGGYFFMEYGYFGYVADKYPWNDGTWLTWNENPEDTVVVNYFTDTPKRSIVSYGTDPTLSSDDTKTIEMEEKNYIHHISIDGLDPDTTYYYRVGYSDLSFSTFENQKIFNFTTAPTGTQNDFSFCVVGDMQPTDERTMTGGEMVAKGIAGENPDFVVQLGDVCSSGGSVSLWHNVLQNLPYFASGRPIQSAVGNHDYGGDHSRNYHEIFPYNYETETANYYSFNYSNAHFVMIDNFVGDSSTLTQAQKDWIIKDLENAQSGGMKWTFMAFHHTILTTGTSGHNWNLQKWLVPVADQYDVDGVFFGHDHHYEHWNYTYGDSGLLYNETDVPTGDETHYWCSGGGGAHLEVDYGLLTHEDYNHVREFYNTTTGEYENITIVREHWNASRYVESEENRIYADSEDDYLYYHAPEKQSYSTGNEIYGYQYGEQALHYMKVEISNSGNTCTISARYPNGEILMGPNEEFPQEWTFNK